MSAERRLKGVGVSYAALQLIVVGVGRAPSWDEAIYLSQVSPNAHALPFVASRARGITLLVLPVARLTSSTEALRLFLIVASAAALVAAFRVWIPVVGGAALAAGAFAFTWLGLLYGSGVMPNLWTALLCVAATGWVTRSVGSPARGDVRRAAICFALMALMRPPDALILAGALGVCVALIRGPLRPILWSVSGAIIGSIPWIVEMSVRFGGPAGALRESFRLSHVASTGFAQRLAQHLALTNGPTLGPVADPSVPPVGALWWGLLAALSVFAVAATRRDMRARPGAALAAIGGIALAAEYLFVIAGLAPRFLLPGYGLLSVSAATGAVLLRRQLASSVVTTALAAAASVLLVWHIGVAGRVTSAIAAADGRSREVGVAIRDAAASTPCDVASDASFPQIGLASGCEARPLQDPSAPSWIAAAPGDGRVGFVALRGTRTALPAGLSGSPIPGPQDWTIYRITSPA